ncbi:hypothetical protein [Marinifilum caeruleilacunae]|uniref:Uncharacterized protein n=1 Tax=Marinifilum caeruleilacunae TaxID=2499076 RepID=A0ABX1WSR4_9BACT|nr:hypothetical protein [Marinifilum caeruleilacunae]NOU59139.1 hypothetical protein [Marinifilum caeruleilacunae]
MKTENISTGINLRVILIFLITSISVLFFLFYIDEGYYSIAWMREPFAYIVFMIYLIPTFLCQLLIYIVLLRVNIATGRTVLSIILGLFLGISLVVSAFYIF